MKFAKDNFLHFDGRMNNILVRENKCFYSAFTLAEMMVVMLILSIIMAAMAPVMTTRNKLDQSAPWSWATNGSDAYYGIGDAQVAMIGQEEVKPTDDGARFIINSPSSLNHILFKNGDTTNGLLNMSNYNVFLGKLSNGQTIGSRSTGLGYDIAPSGPFSVSLGIRSSSSGQYSLSIGRSNSADDLGSIAIGSVNTATARNVIAQGSSNEVSGDYSIAIGQSNTVSGQDSIVLGRSNTLDTDNSIGIGLGVTSAENSIAIGNSSSASGSSSIAIGSNALASTYLSIAIGAEEVNVSGMYGVAIGSNVDALGDSTIAIGNNAESLQPSAVSIGDVTSAGNVSAVAIGSEASASDMYSIALGYSVDATAYRAIAIGKSAYASGKNSIAIGPHARAAGEGAIAIGQEACSNISGKKVVCIGYQSGPEEISLRTEDNVIYLGNKDSTVYIPGSLIVGDNVYLNSKGSGAIILRPSNARTVPMTLRADDRNNFNRNPEYADNLRKYPTDVASDEQTLFNKYGPQSDRRLKYVGSESTSGLDKIRQLKVFNYTFKKDKKKVPHVGVIAQDLQKVFPNAVKKGVDGFLTIRMEDMFYAMINAIKELDLRYRAQEKRIDELEARIQKLEAKLK